MSDLISRQAALDALIALTVYSKKREIVKEADNHPNTWIEGVAECIDEIEDLPSAQPVRHGRWIEDGSFKYKHGGRNSEAKELFGTEWRTMRRIKCSLCNKITLVDDTILYEYCPHCGAKMDGERKEE